MERQQQQQQPRPQATGGPSAIAPDRLDLQRRQQADRLTATPTPTPTTTTTTTVTTIEHLCDDVLAKIFDYLHYDDKIRLRRTCRKWRHLLDNQTRRIKALRLGQFIQGGYQVTSGLAMSCDEHQGGPRRRFHRQETGTLFSDKIFHLRADLETQCFSVAQYDYLHRALKHSYQSIQMLSLGRVHISYRLILVLANNLPHLEHLELIGCATEFEASKRRQTRQAQAKSVGGSLPSVSEEGEDTTMSQVRHSINSNVMYNQHRDEQVNVRERLLRSTFIKNCSLVQEARRRNQWPAMRHLLVKECNLMNEFTLSLLLALTSHSLVQLEVNKNQYLTGEFLNYCGPHLKALKIQHCPSIRAQFIDDLLKIRKLLGSSVQICDIAASEKGRTQSLSSSLKLTTSGGGGGGAGVLSARPRRFAILFSA